MHEDRHHIAIAGAGLTGAILAIALAHEDRPRLKIALCGPRGTGYHDPRAYAIAAGVRRMLDCLGVWPKIADQACPVDEMRISDSRLEDVMRPQLLSLSDETAPGEPVAHIVPAGTLAKAADAIIDDLPIERRDIGQFGDVAVDAGLARLYGEGGNVAAHLLIGADGVNSTVRLAAGIKTVGWDYGQSGVVATLGATLPHHNRAIQHFLPEGPFALLPLPDNHYSLVCSMPHQAAQALAGRDEAAITAALELRAGAEIGPLRLESEAVVFPLELKMARQFVTARIALAGDAAHRLHPLAGQGQNMGLRDVAALAEVILDAARLGEDIGSLAVLERYQRWRRFDTVQMAMTMEALKRLFSNDIAPLRALRDLGLGVVDRLGGLKMAMIRDAGGLTGNPPRLLLGLPA